MRHNHYEVAGAALKYTFGPVARSLTGRPEVDLVASGTGGTSATDGTMIYIHIDNDSLMHVLADDDPKLLHLMAVTGATYHEICHLLYSDFCGPYDKWCKDNDMKHVANMLDDQRIENFMVRHYAPVRDYFIDMITQLVISKGTEFDNKAWMLLAGRYYLPDEIRAKAKSAMTNTRARDEASEIIDAFCAITDIRAESADAIELTEKFAKLVARHMNNPPEMCQSGRSYSSEARQGQVQPQAGQERKEGVKGESAPSGEGQGEAEGKEAQEGAESGESQGEGASAGDINTDSSGGRYGLSDALNEARKQAQENLRQGADLHERARAMDYNKQYYRPTDSGSRNIDDWSRARTKIEPTDELRNVVAKMARGFEILRSEVDSGWLSGSDHGRVNVELVIEAEHTGDWDVFDSWNEGVQDATDIEVVLLLDLSDSMRMHINKACEATWALRRAVDSAQGTMTVLGYSTEWGVVVNRGEPTPNKVPIYQVRSYTTATPATREALRILDSSQRAVKMFFIVTDGMIHDRGHLDTVVNNQPYHWGIVGIGKDADYVEDYWKVGADRPGLLFSKMVGDAFQLGPLINDAMVNLARKRALRGDLV